MKTAKRSPKTVQRDPRPEWLECVLRVESVTRISGVPDRPPLFEIEIDLETGRTHQIRAQLSTMGCPIVGDKLYGSTKSYEVNGNLQRGIALASTSAAWTDEEGETWSFVLSDPSCRLT
jgi:23S rRNA-/tRNA-specific pseudouridylate synthase